jgi:hypothetical protein
MTFVPKEKNPPKQVNSIVVCLIISLLSLIISAVSLYYKLKC